MSHWCTSELFPPLDKWTMTPNLVTWKVNANVIELSKIFTVLLEKKCIEKVIWGCTNGGDVKADDL